MAWGGGLTGLGQLMSVGAGLGKAYQDYQEQQHRQRQQQMAIEEFRMRQDQQRRQLEAMSLAGQGLQGVSFGQQQPLAPSPMAGPPPGAQPAAPPAQQAAFSPPSQSGSTYDLPGLRNLAINAGFQGPSADRMAAISMAESGGRPDAVNAKDPGGSYGLTQVNAKAHGDQYARAALDPPTAFKEAFDISKGGTDFKPWTTAKTGADQPFLAQLQQAGANPRQAQALAPVAASMGADTLEQYAANLRKIAPNADPATLAGAMEIGIKMLHPIQQERWDREKFWITEGRQRDTQAETQRHDRAMEQSQGGIGTVMQPEGGPPVFVGRGGIAKPITDDQGNPLQTPLSKPGSGGPRNVPAMIMQQYRKEHPAANADDMVRFQSRYAADQSIARSFGGGMAGRNLTALNTVADHVLIAREYAEALRNNDVPRANQALNRLATETGRPEIKDFNTAKTIMADEIVRLLTSTGGTEQDRKGLQELFDAMGSPEQLAGTLNVATRMVSGRLKALEQQYARNDPAKRSEFENEMLTDTARRVFSDQMPGAADPQGTPANPGEGGKVIKLDADGNVIE